MIKYFEILCNNNNLCSQKHTRPNKRTLMNAFNTDRYFFFSEIINLIANDILELDTILNVTHCIIKKYFVLDMRVILAVIIIRVYHAFV